MIFTILFAIGSLGPNAHLEPAGIYVGPTLVAPGESGPFDCALYRISVNLGILAPEVLEGCTWRTQA